MGYGLKLLALFCSVSLLYVVGIFFFTRGFLLKRLVINEYSECSEFPHLLSDQQHSSNTEGCWLKKRHGKAVILIIDALRYDFALYNESLDEQEALPYHNKLKVIRDVLERMPEHGALFRFVADPPTTTMQRLKGLTTGSLPTFVDAGKNFASSNITEDNLISQLKSLQKNITFMGDDTWGSLFPDSFHKSFPFPSFNVMDLHTVDNGVIAHLIPEIKTNDWDVLIGHFLGVDHCGHKYGPNHPEMTSKLSQMDAMLRSVIETLDEDTVLFVMGDHGMTRTGDHGGDSDDEVDAALFVYSPKPLTTCNTTKKRTTSVSQIDLVPTFSLLLGLPIPFGNLGTVIPDLFCHDAEVDSRAFSANNKNRTILREVLSLLQRNAAFELNAKQVHKYLTTYTLVSGEISVSTFEELAKILHNATSLVSETKRMVNKFGGFKGIIEDATVEELIHLHKMLTSIEEFFVNYLSRAKALCQSLWAKFDLNSIFVGISLLFIGIAAVVLTLLDKRIQLSLLAVFPLMGLSIASAVTSFSFEFTILIISFVVCGLILGTFVFLRKVTIKKTEGSVGSFYQNSSTDGILAMVLCFLQCVALFSNSFTVNEDKIIAFFIEALITVKCVQGLWKCGLCENRKSTLRQSFRKSGKKELKRASTTGFFLRLSFAWIAFQIVNRTAITLKGCREEQWYCVPTNFLKPLSALTENSAAGNRFLLTMLCAAVIPLSVRQWLRYQGNLNGPSFVVLCIKFALPAAFVMMCVHWALQIVPQEMNSALPELQLWQQIILPQVVYCLCVVTVTCLLYSPLCIYTIFRGRKNSFNETVKSLQSTEDNSKIIHALVREIKQKWDGLDGNKTQIEDGGRDEENMPVVYGLATVYSSPLLVLSLAVALPLMMLLGNGMSLSVVLMCVQMFLLLEVRGLSQDVKSDGSDSSISDPSWSMVVLWHFLSSYYFYCTGHQATIPSIRFEAAFVGFPGDMENLILPGFLILLNTFSGPVLFAFSLPLLLFWPQIPNRLLGIGNKGGLQSRKGEFDWIEAPDLLRTRMFRLVLMYQILNGVKLLASCCSAALHRRHLMVWKIFAPRFVFEGISFLLTTVVLAASFLAVLRVDQALRSWFKRLEASDEWKTKNR